jgi:hypothetical protein
MFRSQPERRIYTGPIVFGSQPLTWIKKHRSFASKEWFLSQIRYGEWIRERNKPHDFLIYATNIDGIRQVTVLIKIKRLETHVLAYHAHVLRKK